MKKIRKGFTLVELLAVIVVLGLLAAIVSVPIIKTLKGSKSILNSAQTVMIVAAAKNLGMENFTKLPDSDKPTTKCITISELVNKGFLEEVPKNLETDEEIDANSGVKISCNNNSCNKLIYEYVDSCDGTLAFFDKVTPVKTYTVSFDLRGGTGTFEPQTIVSGELATKPSSEPTKAGDDFVYWSYNNKEYDFAEPVTKHLTLEAWWQSDVEANMIKLNMPTVTIEGTVLKIVAGSVETESYEIFIDGVSKGTIPATNPTEYDLSVLRRGNYIIDVVAKGTGVKDSSKVTVEYSKYYYTDEEIEASEYLYAIGKNNPSYVVAEFNDDYTLVTIFKNGSDSDGVMADWSLLVTDHSPMYANRRTLANVNLEPGVTSIGSYAFLYCDRLTSITIPSSIISISITAFDCCDRLTSIIVDENNEYYSNDEHGVLFNKNKTILVKFPEGYTNTTYTIPSSVTSIGDSAFIRCYSLTSITIPSSIISIGNSAFDACRALTSITIPSSVTSIGSYAFIFCESLTSITFKGSKSQWNAISFGDRWNEYTGDYTVYCTNGNIYK